MKYPAFFAIMTMLLLAGCTGTQQYSNILKGFSTVQPAGWGVYEDDMRVVFAPTDMQGAQISVMSVYSKENASLENLSYSMKARFTAQGGMSLINESDRTLTVSGEPALEQTLRLSYMQYGVQKESFQRFVYLKKGGRYFIIFLVFSPQEDALWKRQDEFENAFDSAVSNFKLI